LGARASVLVRQLANVYAIPRAIATAHRAAWMPSQCENQTDVPRSRDVPRMDYLRILIPNHRSGYHKDIKIPVKRRGTRSYLGKIRPPPDGHGCSGMSCQSLHTLRARVASSCLVVQHPG